MSEALRVVIVGGVAAGPKVASKVIRLCQDAEVTVIERGELLSYAGCGLPYYISGAVKEQKELMSTPVGVVRDPVFFQNVKNVKVLNRTEALEIDRTKKSIKVCDLQTHQESWLPYDKLVLATGASPVVPPIPGTDLDNVFTLQGVHDAEGIRSALAESKARDVVIVGGGLIGVETTEALVEHGCRVTMVEMLPQILRILDADMAKLVEKHMESHGVKVLTDTRLEAIDGDDTVTAVQTSAGRFSADMVIMAIGVRPSVSLAQAADLEIGTSGGIKVNECMQTSDPDIYAAGDCVECHDLMTGKGCFVPLGSTANKQGRVAAVNLCGGDDRFPGVLGSTVCKVFDFCVARTGLGEANEETRQEWIKRELPKIRKAVKKYRAILYFQDESNISLTALLGKTWSPRGKTPTQKVTGKRGGIAAMSAISKKGGLIFTLHDKRLASPEIIHFMRQMLKHHPRRHLVVVMDRARPHISQKTQEFIASQKRLHVFYLPSYSPDWNPDEYVWNHLKIEYCPVFLHSLKTPRA
ncbi:IS630 family transposase [Planctomycetota bacterium]